MLLKVDFTRWIGKILKFGFMFLLTEIEVRKKVLNSNLNFHNSEENCLYKQLMAEEKYPKIYSRQIEAIMFSIFEICFSQHPKSFQNW